MVLAPAPTDAAVEEPLTATAPAPPVEPASPVERRRVTALRATGASLLGVGGASLVTSFVLFGVANAAAHRVADGSSPGPIGFPSARWRDLAPDERLAQRATIAARTLAVVGPLMMIAGAITLGIGNQRRRDLRERRVAWSPRGLALRW